MLGQGKKRNVEPSGDGDEGSQGAQAPPTVLPPLRTFVIRKAGYSWKTVADAWGFTLVGDTDVPRTVHAHGLAIDEARMISFIVFLRPNPNDQTLVAQTNKLILNSDAWDEVEEINVLFPELEAH